MLESPLHQRGQPAVVLARKLVADIPLQQGGSEQVIARGCQNGQPSGFGGTVS